MTAREVPYKIMQVSQLKLSWALVRNMSDMKREGEMDDDFPYLESSVQEELRMLIWLTLSVILIVSVVIAIAIA